MNITTIASVLSEILSARTGTEVRITLKEVRTDSES
jgi:hypothetical protein